MAAQLDRRRAAQLAHRHRVADDNLGGAALARAERHEAVAGRRPGALEGDGRVGERLGGGGAAAVVAVVAVGGRAAGDDGQVARLEDEAVKGRLVGGDGDEVRVVVLDGGDDGGRRGAALADGDVEAGEGI